MEIFKKSHQKSLEKTQKARILLQETWITKKDSLSAENLNDTVTAGAGKVVTTYKILCFPSFVWKLQESECVCNRKRWQ